MTLPSVVVGDLQDLTSPLHAPPGFEAYFRELSAGLANVRSDDEGIELRHRLSTSYAASLMQL